MPGSLADSRCLASWVGRGGIGLAQQPPKRGEPSLETDAGDREGDNLTDGPPLVDRDHPGSSSRMILPACQSALPPRGGCGAIVPPVRAPHAHIARRQGPSSENVHFMVWAALVPPGTDKCPSVSRTHGARSATCRLGIVLRCLISHIARSDLPKRSSSGRWGG